MGNRLEDENVISPELWRMWDERGKRHHKVVARRINVSTGLLIGILSVACAFYLFIAK